jgi:hypothetical protein
MEYRHCEEQSDKAIHKQDRALVLGLLFQERPLLWIAASGKALLAMTDFLVCSFINENWYKKITIRKNCVKKIGFVNIIFLHYSSGLPKISSQLSIHNCPNS